jgi:hypothetical protein
MVVPKGIEPFTSCMSYKCSTDELEDYGAHEGIRTLVLSRPVLSGVCIPIPPRGLVAYVVLAIRLS